MSHPRFKRILLKLSGEVLMGPGQFGIDPATVDRVAGEIAEAKQAGHELCVVVGGGNIFRGLAGAAKGEGPGMPPAANLTPAGELKGWTEAQFFRAMHTGIRPNGQAIRAPMPSVIIAR